MKMALKLNRKELLSLYEKSSEQVKETLRAEFGAEFFMAEKKQEQPIASIPKDMKTAVKDKVKQSINWEVVSDFTPILRILGYAYLMWLIL